MAVQCCGIPYLLGSSSKSYEIISITVMYVLAFYFLYHSVQFQLMTWTLIFKFLHILEALHKIINIQASPCLHYLPSSFSLIYKFESPNMKISTVQITQLPFILLLGNICWENKWNLAAMFIPKSLEIPLLHFESSWDILIFRHFPNVVINQSSPLYPCNSCLICINKYWDTVWVFFFQFPQGI